MSCCRTRQLVMGPACGSPLLLLRLGPAPRAAVFPFLAPVGTCKLNSFSFLSGVDNLPLSHPPFPSLAKCRVPASVAPFFFIILKAYSWALCDLRTLLSSLWRHRVRQKHMQKNKFPETSSVFEFWVLSSCGNGKQMHPWVVVLHI